MTGIMIGFTRARHLLGTVYGNYSLNSIDTGLNVYGSGLYGIGGATLTLPASPSTLQTIEINNTGTGTVIVPGTLTKAAVNYLRAELAPKARIKIRWNGTTWDVIFEYGTIVYIPIPTYATWNPADKGDQITLSNGNLTASFPWLSSPSVRSTISKTSGKWYWEYHVDAMTIAGGFNTSYLCLGIATSNAGLLGMVGKDSFGWAYRLKMETTPDTTDKFNSDVGIAYGTIITVGDTIGIALDMDSGSITFYLNNVSQGVAYSNLLDAASAIFAAIGAEFLDDETSAVITGNFGASAFTYSVPSGYNSGLYE